MGRCGENVHELLMAAAVALSGLTVLHLDKDFDLIAEVTGRSVERLTGAF
jgi:predicted nucleic acid-binding protein